MQSQQDITNHIRYNRWIQLTTREIANELNISQKTVQNQVGNTLEFIRQRFGHLLLIILSVFLSE